MLRVQTQKVHVQEEDHVTANKIASISALYFSHSSSGNLYQRHTGETMKDINPTVKGTEE